MSKVPVIVRGSLARRIHGLDEAVSIDRMRLLILTLAYFIADRCGVEPNHEGLTI